MRRTVVIKPYLMVENGKEAIELYKELFGGELVEHRPFTEEMGSSLGFPEDFDYINSTMHAVLDIHGATLMLSDNVMRKSGSGNVQVLIMLDSKEAIDKINEKVQEKKFTIIMPCKIYNGDVRYHCGWDLFYLLYSGLFMVDRLTLACTYGILAI